MLAFDVFSGLHLASSIHMVLVVETMLWWHVEHLPTLDWWTNSLEKLLLKLFTFLLEIRYDDKLFIFDLWSGQFVDGCSLRLLGVLQSLGLEYGHYPYYRSFPGLTEFIHLSIIHSQTWNPARIGFACAVKGAWKVLKNRPVFTNKT